MAQLFSIHPQNPQARLIAQAVKIMLEFHEERAKRIGTAQRNTPKGENEYEQV